MSNNTRPKDMRTWIDDLEAAKELIRIDKPVDPLTQMGALLYQSREKALFFERLPHGWRSLGQAPANMRHAALAFGVAEEALVPHVAGKLGTLIPPATVDGGPVKDVKLGKGEFDLTELPVHVAGQRDGGPVIGSGLVVSRDPDTGARNLSFHRLQIKGPQKSGILLYPRHTWRNYLKYQARGEPMPVAVFIGHHPLYYVAAATTAAYGADELAIAGGLLGHPVPLVRCETVDLEVPADAEIVLEGHIPPHYREDEGPFSEFQDYYVTGTGQNPVVEYQCMTRRRDAIFKNLQNGSEMEGCVFHKVPMCATIARDGQLMEVDVIDVASRVLRFQACSIFIFDARSQTYVLRASTGAFRSRVGEFNYSPGEGFTGWVCESGQPIMLDHPQGDPRWRGKYTEIPSDEIACFLAAPILVRTKIRMASPTTASPGRTSGSTRSCAPSAGRPAPG